MRGRALLALVIAVPVLADEWPGPQVTNIHSANGAYFVRVNPGSQKGAPARGEFYARQKDRSYKLVADVALPNPVAPVDALLSNDGRLITFDNWFRSGYGKVVVIYRSDGKVVKSYSLEDLYPKDKVALVPTSVSSRWWRCRPWAFSDPDTQQKVYVMEHSGGYFVFHLPSGRFEYTPGQAKCES